MNTLRIILLRAGIYFPANITRLLGLKQDANINRTEEQTKQNLVPTDFYKSFHTLMVLCPNVAETRVNNKMLPILRLFNVDNATTEETINYEWASNPIYFALNSDYIDKIQLYLANTTGKQLSGMTTGETVILTHFRQKRQPQT